jgi:hypothetical protein
MAWVTSVLLQGKEADPPMSCIVAAAVWACLFNIAQFLTNFDKTEAGNKKIRVGYLKITNPAGCGEVVGGRVDKCLFPPPLWGGLGSSAVASGSEAQAADVCSSQMLDSE